MTSIRLCFYCGCVLRKIDKGEHIIPEAIGGVRTIKNVCRKCNNETLSQLDTELCSHSSIAIIAGKILAKKIGLTWDVDESEGNLLLEMQPTMDYQSDILWPQLILVEDRMQLHGDHEEIIAYGRQNFQEIFLECLQSACQRHKEIGKGLFFRKRPACPQQGIEYMYHPRVFAEKRISDFSSDMKFMVGYENKNEKEKLLRELEKFFSSQNRFDEMEVRLGSQHPVVARSWDQGKLLRALIKFGLNLLYDTCQQTIVNKGTFPEAIELVFDKNSPTHKLMNNCGFVRPCGLKEIHRTDDGHAFRLVYDALKWSVYFSFFGGRIAAVIHFPGNNQEKWRTADISTPLVSTEKDVSKEWDCQRSALILRPSVRCVEWGDLQAMIPSLTLENLQSRIRVERC